MLARRLGMTARTLRPTYLALAERGELRITQGGVEVEPATLCGPFRVALATPARSSTDSGSAGLEVFERSRTDELTR